MAASMPGPWASHNSLIGPVRSGSSSAALGAAELNARSTATTRSAKGSMWEVI